jgi:hypothetical protein
MPIKLVVKGAMFTVSSWRDKGESESNYDKLLNQLTHDGSADATSLVFTVDYLAHQGIPTNKEKFRKLTDEIWEIKAPRTSRVLCFFDKGRLIICTHGFTGKKRGSGKTPSGEIIRATAIREKYMKETKTNAGQ